MAISSSVTDPLSGEIASHNINLNVCNTLARGDDREVERIHEIEAETYPSEEVNNYWCGVQKFHGATAFYYNPQLKDHDLRSISSEALSAFFGDAKTAGERVDEEELGNIRLFEKVYNSTDGPFDRWQSDKGWPHRSYLMLKSNPVPRKRSFEEIDVDDDESEETVQDGIEKVKDNWNQKKSESPNGSQPRVNRASVQRIHGKKARCN